MIELKDWIIGMCILVPCLILIGIILTCLVNRHYNKELKKIEKNELSNIFSGDITYFVMSCKIGYYIARRHRKSFSSFNEINNIIICSFHDSDLMDNKLVRYIEW